ncbi:hypothetical protein SPRG_06519 [Saprolegnia parasitica CBS 223.65]|uniref:Uncharacterized protein n=1 Tax=Saprolegnia parasitica (strain CBS 223.65) TaxID=695850 RepID=A0A067CHN4_SAPPC|nr:hypothetical protein SPRG_06519 [Saprolegnia parasitica CBS 223.65]KDO28665.1 hypothetical protein SPRG_06519 [Saprolegnia parasitica CBS 223.65]|eukprot:XP_012200724.1 hypothetical protein SPRG_06519 [Saprolegnia parasitica CBS 223.65]
MAMDDAATWGHLDVVEFLQTNHTEGCTVDALDGAITHGHLDVARFLMEHRSEGASPNILDLAAANGHLDVVKYLHSLGSFGCTVAAVDKAASNGHLKVATFLLTNRNAGCTRDMVVRYALKRGHERTTEYLLSLGPEMRGVVQRLLARGMPCDPRWIAQASAVNNVPLVRFLHEHPNHSCHPEAMQAAIVNEAWDVVDFLLAHCTAKVAVDALRAALSFSNLDVSVRMLQRHPELRNDNLLALAIHSHDIKVTGYLLAAGIGKPRECLIEIVGRRNYVTMSNLLLPYCMGATDHIGNVTFLLDLLELPDSRRARRRATTLQLISPSSCSKEERPVKRSSFLPAWWREQQV